MIDASMPDVVKKLPFFRVTTATFGDLISFHLSCCIDENSNKNPRKALKIRILNTSLKLGGKREKG